MKKVLKRVFIALGIIVLLLLAVGAVAFFYLRNRFMGPTIEIKDPDNAAVVTTTYGDVRGYISDDGIYTYHGIPYAQAKERFVAATEPDSWEGVLDTTEWGPISPQGAILGGAASESDNGDNNCQNLNLWTPALDDGKRPVMVWLHGGGFSSGSANGGNTDGTNLALNQDVVVIGVNHRLNVYGYLDLTEYGEKYEHSDNAGLTDIVASLDWIKENVATFGGDPDNITVFGQSGGGAKVLSLMTSPYAEGKFQKGIVQSGATETLGVTFATKEQSLAITERILDKLGITKDNIEDIKTVSNADLQNAATQALAETGAEFEVPLAIGDGYGMEWGPVIDGDYMPTAPITEDGFADAGFNVPLLIGSNIDEWSMAGLRREATDEEKAVFSEAYPNEPESGADTVDTLIRLPMLKIMSHKADQGGANVYAYMFTHQEPPMGAYHGAEISYAFYNSGEKNGMNDLISSVWTSFARNGIPSAEGLETWEPYTREHPATMILDDKSYLTVGHDEELMHMLAPDYEW